MPDDEILFYLTSRKYPNQICLDLWQIGFSYEHPTNSQIYLDFLFDIIGLVVNNLEVQFSVATHGGPMRQPMIDDFVRLTCDIPELALNRGQVGVVRGRRPTPDMVYEVEFHRIGHDYQTWAWL